MRYAIVEVFGHRRYAGAVEEATLAGAAVLRVTVPAWEEREVERDYLYEPDPVTGLMGSVERDVHDAHQSFVVDLGGAAVFACTWCDESRVMHVLRAERTMEGPIVRTESAWRRRAEPARQLPPPPPSEDDLPDEYGDESAPSDRHTLGEYTYDEDAEDDAEDADAAADAAAAP